MKARTRRRGELIWPTLIVKKWLNIKPNVDGFSQDESDNESYLEDDDSSSVEQNPFSDNENDNESNQTLFRCQTSGTPSKLLLRRLRRHKSETRRVQYIDTKEIKISVGTWNVAGRLPPDDLEIDKWLGIKEPADMYVLGGKIGFSYPYLTKSGVYDFWNWFDDRTWYPPGRVIGGTVYPGLTLTAGTMWWVFNALNIPLSVETVCVFTAPIFSANAAWATYLLKKEVKGIGAGLTAAAILAMTLNTGSLFYATLNALAYFYMVCSWGGYTFIINLIPMHVLLCIVTGRFTEADAGRGFDRVRRTEIGKKHFKLTHFEEVFTTHHWMVCIYKLKPSKNRLRGKNKKRTKSSTKRGKYSSSKKQEKKNPWH